MSRIVDLPHHYPLEGVSNLRDLVPGGKHLQGQHAVNLHQLILTRQSLGAERKQCGCRQGGKR